MNSEQARNIGIVMFAVVLAVAVVSCGKKSDQSQTTGAAQQAGIEADRIASNTVEAAQQAAEKTKKESEAAIKKTGEILEEAGAEIEKAGESIQK